ncbi:hypothetical protein DV736_g6171, partial [Chaetothyriales sp. CBS 134916]
MSRVGLTLTDDSEDSSPRAGFRGGWQDLSRPLSSTRSSRPTLQSSLQLRDSVINAVERLNRRFFKVWRKLSTLQKVLVIIGLTVLSVGGILFLVFNEKIFGWLEPYAEKWKGTKGGWTILWAAIFVAAFPPMIGYSSCATTAGFVYGVWEGWLILATATVAGSFASFIVSRTILRNYVERMVANDKRFAALTMTLKEDGLKLLCMIRLCPLPFSLSNGAMAIVPSVEPQAFALATALITPKLFIHVFIGSRLAAIAKSHEQMSTGAKLLNYTSILFGAVVGGAVGWYIYQKTMARSRQLETGPGADVPTPKFTDDPEEQLASGSLGDDEDEDDAPDYFDESPELRYTDEGDDDPFSRGDETDDERIIMYGHKR